MKEMGWDLGKFALAAEIKAAEQSQALCDGNIDVFFYTVGHPSGAIKEATTSCDSVVVNVDNAATQDRKSTRLNSSHVRISYAVFCLKKKTQLTAAPQRMLSPPSVARAIGPGAIWIWYSRLFLLNPSFYLFEQRFAELCTRLHSLVRP